MYLPSTMAILESYVRFQGCNLGSSSSPIIYLKQPRFLICFGTFVSQTLHLVDFVKGKLNVHSKYNIPYIECLGFSKKFNNLRSALPGKK